MQAIYFFRRRQDTTRCDPLSLRERVRVRVARCGDTGVIRRTVDTLTLPSPGGRGFAWRRQICFVHDTAPVSGKIIQSNVQYITQKTDLVHKTPNWF
jgi:hypothetical protein